MSLQLEEVLSKIQEHLSQTPRQNLGDPLAAVLIPFFEKADETHVLLTQRASSLRKHSGQISFPGGKIENQDRSIIETAIRETEEEVGLDRAELNIIDIFHDFATPYYSAVTPVIATFSYPQSYIIQEEEIDRVLEVPMTDLLDPQIYHSEVWEYEGLEYLIHFYDWQDSDGANHNIWGATAGVLNSILSLVNSD